MNKFEITNFFKDKKGRTVLWQSPNLLLWGWLVFRVLAWLIPDAYYKNGFGRLSTAILFAWGFLELTKGVNYFRKFVGLVVLVLITLSFFRL